MNLRSGPNSELDPTVLDPTEIKSDVKPDDWNVRFGSKAPDAMRAWRSTMSAPHPIATELVRRGSPRLPAISGCEQAQHGGPSFDHLVSDGEQRRRYGKAKHARSRVVDDELEL